MATLRIASGDLMGRVFEIAEDRFSIGRAAGNTVVLDDQAASGKHCEVVRQGRKFSLRDLGSTNGTTLNGVLVRESRLRAKDIIGIGSAELILEGDDIENEDPEALKEGIRTGQTLRLPTRPPTDVPFETRHTRKWAWRLVLSLAGVLVLVALGFVLMRMFFGA